jgi:uncharacterized membrane protein
MGPRSAHRNSRTPALAAGMQDRSAWLDAARGLAIAQMVAYHFCYDLEYFGWVQLHQLEDARWIAWRSLIVGQFLFLAGVGLGLRKGPASAYGARHWRRWAQVAGAALLVSVATRVLFGPRFIWFGVLHFMVCAQLMAPALRGLGRWNLATGAGLLGLGLLVQLPAFSPDTLSWIGFSPVKPQSEDFVPLMPWLGVLVAGMGFARLTATAHPPLQGPAVLQRAARGLALAGRWPLSVYLLHQPVLFGILLVLRAGG